MPWRCPTIPEDNQAQSRHRPPSPALPMSKAGGKGALRGQKWVRRTLPPGQLAASVPEHHSLLVGEGLGDSLPQIPGAQKGEAPSTAGLGGHTGLWGAVLGENDRQRLSSRATAAATLPTPCGCSPTGTVAILSSPSSHGHGRVLSAPRSYQPSQPARTAERKNGLLPSQLCTWGLCPGFCGARVGRKMQTEPPPSPLSQGSLSTCHWVLGEEETRGPSCSGSASCLL